MATVFCCGFHCGVAGTAGMHVHNGGSGTRSFSEIIPGVPTRRFNGGTKQYDNLQGNISTTTRILVASFDLYFTTKPSADCSLFAVERSGGNCEGLGWQNSSSSIRPFTNNSLGVMTFGANGVTIANGNFVHVDIKIDDSVNPRTIDVSIDGVALTQLTRAVAAQDLDFLAFGGGTACSPNNNTCDVHFMNMVISQTAGDYPIGKTRVIRVSPNRDGTHNTANTANCFERGNTGTDIIDSTTDAYLLIDDSPLPSGATDGADCIQITLNAPTNTWYTEHQFTGLSRYILPITVEAILAHHQTSGLATVYQIRVRDKNGATEDTMVNISTAQPGNSYQYVRKHYATIPGSGGSAWTKAAFNALAVRFGYSSDASPDIQFDAFMFEVAVKEEFFLGRPYGPIGQNHMHQLLVR